MHDLLLQRAIQTQLRYYDDMHNEVMTAWLQGFLNHTHLDNGEMWHSVVGMHVSMEEYFRVMLQTKVGEGCMRSHSVRSHFARSGAIRAPRTKRLATHSPLSPCSLPSTLRPFSP